MTAVQDGTVPEVDWLRRGLHAMWPNAPRLLGASAFTTAVLVATLQLAPSAVHAALVLGIAAVPLSVLLTHVARGVVLREHGDGRSGSGGGGMRRNLRAGTVAAAPVVAVLLALAGWESHGRAGTLATGAAAAVGSAVALAGVLLAPTALALVLERPRAPWRGVWVVAALATARRPVPVLGGWAAAAVLAALATRVQILLLVVPGVGAVVLLAAAWTALAAIVVRPDP